jgi:hypothetical protein
MTKFSRKRDPARFLNCGAGKAQNKFKIPNPKQSFENFNFVLILNFEL